MNSAFLNWITKSTIGAKNLSKQYNLSKPPSDDVYDGDDSMLIQRSCEAKMLYKALIENIVQSLYIVHVQSRLVLINVVTVIHIIITS